MIKVSLYFSLSLSNLIMLIIILYPQDLSEESSRSYHKRVSIVETIAKVRSCVLMLDLECDDLIVEMIEHFMKSVRYAICCRLQT